jgi:hypothetical protein
VDIIPPIYDYLTTIQIEMQGLFIALADNTRARRSPDEPAADTSKSNNDNKKTEAKNAA